jgi:hypothetical protein
MAYHDFPAIINKQIFPATAVVGSSDPGVLSIGDVRIFGGAIRSVENTKTSLRTGGWSYFW